MKYSGVAPPIAALALMIALAACSSAKTQDIEPLGLGARCGSNAGCRKPLACRLGTCQTTASIPAGAACILSDDCEVGLICYFAVCTAAGEGIAGSSCASAIDCERGLYCAFEGFAGTCKGDGATDLAGSCETPADCLAGLICDPISASCATQYSDPVGTACAADTDCLPGLGIVCDSETLQCGGTGPDGLPVPPWDGVSCAPSNALDGAFRAYFEVPRSGAANDFFRLPFPNDARVSAEGGIDLSAFPQPPANVVPLDFNDRFVSAFASDVTGFGANEAVFFRFSGPPLLCPQDCGSGCPAGCMGTSEPKPTIYVVEIRDADGQAVAKFSPISFTWTASTARTKYLCWNYLVVMPSPTDSWRPGRTYAVFLPSYLRGADNEIMTQDSDFAAMLEASSPGAELDQAWSAYAPLRSWLALAPTFPHDGSFIEADDLAVAAVLTIRDPKVIPAALATAIAAAPAAEPSDYNVCAATSSACADPVTEAFIEVQGHVALPNFQQGSPPYESIGGSVAVTNGVAQLQADVSARFSLSVPKGTPPADGWPVVVYAHGTGGDYRSYIDEGVAALLADASFEAEPAPMAVFSWDAVAHGERRGTSEIDADLLFFNLANPVAAKGNGLQAMGEALAVTRALDSVAADLAALGQLTALVGAAVTLDTTALAFFGHSQGAHTGLPALAYSDRYEVAVLSGAGAGLIDVLGARSSPFDVPALLRMALGDPGLDEPRRHPVLNLVQAYLEEIDPINFAQHITANTLDGSNGTHVLHILGVGDAYTPNVTALLLATRLDTKYVDDDDSDLVDAVAVVTPPIKDSPTRVTSIHRPALSADGHFVAFENDDARARIAAFFASWWLDANRTPTVIP